MSTTDDAVAVFSDAENMAHDKLVSGGKGAGLWGRFSQKARQLAMIESCSRSDETNGLEIDEEAARWGVRLAEIITLSMERIADEWLASNLLESQVQRVLRIIKDEPGITQNQLTRRTQWLRVMERQEMIDTLINSGQIRWEDSETGKRKSMKFFAVRK